MTNDPRLSLELSWTPPGVWDGDERLDFQIKCKWQCKKHDRLIMTLASNDTCFTHDEVRQIQCLDQSALSLNMKLIIYIPILILCTPFSFAAPASDGRF